MNTQEGNKLIGDFMGKSFKDPLNYMYDKSWDWLMPVVEKISKLSPLNIDMSSWGAKIRLSDAGLVVKDENLIVAIWTSVVKYIQWYNQNK